MKTIKPRDKKLIVILCGVILLAAAVYGIYRLTVWSQKPETIFKNVKADDVEKLTVAIPIRPEPHTVKNEDIGEFLDLLKGLDSQTPMERPTPMDGDNPLHFNLTMKNGETYLIIVGKGFLDEENAAMTDGTIKVGNDGMGFECDCKPFEYFVKTHTDLKGFGYVFYDEKKGEYYYDMQAQT